MHHEGREGQEVRVLADSFNHMLDRLSDAFDGQRAFVADASHELRTPLTVIRGQIEVLASQREPSGEEVRRVARLVQAEIGACHGSWTTCSCWPRASRASSCGPNRSTCPCSCSELWDGMSLIADRRFELAPGARRPAHRRPGPARAGPAQPRFQRDRAHGTGDRARAPGHQPRAGVAASASSSRTTGPASPPTSASASSTASTAPTRRATGPPAARAWAWRSSERSPTRTAAS